jgi:hypothetical protein
LKSRRGVDREQPNLVRTDKKSPQWEALSVKRNPKGIQADVHVLIHRPAERLPTVLLAP